MNGTSALFQGRWRGDGRPSRHLRRSQRNTRQHCRRGVAISLQYGLPRTVSWAGREWNLVQDAWWWAVDQLPLGGIKRDQGLMRPSVKMCVWLGPPDCHRNQDAVLWTPSDELSARHRSDIALRTGPSGKPTGTRPSPGLLTSGAGPHRSICFRYLSAEVPAQGISTLR